MHNIVILLNKRTYFSLGTLKMLIYTSGKRIHIPRA